MELSDFLIEAFGRIRATVHRGLDGIAPDALTFRADPDANTIAWLVWHIARIQDDHISDLRGGEQTWIADGWCERFALPFPPSAIGYGDTSADVAAVVVSAADLLGYYDAVHDATVAYLAPLTPDDLDRVVDTSWDPPVTLGVRVASVLSDNLQHAGQAAFIRGLAERNQA